MICMQFWKDCWACWVGERGGRESKSRRQGWRLCRSPGERWRCLRRELHQWRGMKWLDSGHILELRPWAVFQLCFSILICRMNIMIPACPSHRITGESHCEIASQSTKHPSMNLSFLMGSLHLDDTPYFPSQSHHPAFLHLHDSPGREVAGILFFKKGEL